MLMPFTRQNSRVCMFEFINGVDKVIWPPQRDLSSDFSSVNLASHAVVFRGLVLNFIEFVATNTY